MVRRDVRENGPRPAGRPRRVPGVRLPPLGLRLQGDHGLQHGQRRGVGGRLGATGLAQHAVDLGELLDDPVGHLQQLLRFGDGDARHGGGHVEDRPLLQRRHELRAESEIDRHRDDYQGERSPDDHAHFQRRDQRLPARRAGSANG